MLAARHPLEAILESRRATRSAGDVDEELLEACLVDRAEHGFDLPGGTDHHDGVLDRDGESNEGLP